MKGCKNLKIANITVYVDGRKVNKNNLPSTGSTITVKLICDYYSTDGKAWIVSDCEGTAKLMEGDKFDYKTGFDIAFSRAKLDAIGCCKTVETNILTKRQKENAKINNRIKELNTIKYGEELVVDALSNSELLF